jgi:hypothetical protein
MGILDSIWSYVDTSSATHARRDKLMSFYERVDPSKLHLVQLRTLCVAVHNNFALHVQIDRFLADLSWESILHITLAKYGMTPDDVTASHLVHQQNGQHAQIIDDRTVTKWLHFSKLERIDFDPLEGARRRERRERREKRERRERAVTSETKLVHKDESVLLHWLQIVVSCR